MQLLSVNIGHKRTQQKGSELEITGIYKIPVQEPVEIKSLGIPGDVICDTKNHGGPDQAIYVYGKPDYDWWSNELGRKLEPGTFGENLTISERESADFNIGDRLYVGSTILEITAPRIPCSTLAARMGDPQFVKKYRRAERPGLYCRVIQEGSVRTGNEIKVERHQGETISILQMFRDYYDNNKSEETLRRHLRAPIAIRARRETEEDLQKLLSRR
ncbi:MAG TPA: MOSC domain-containing protein [Anaerolineales bacterium]|nr:MOSC domain-containing protein [Anaerolineales bacterium]